MINVGQIAAAAGRKAGLLIQKNAPMILTVAGCIGVGVTAVLASKATLKLDDALKETKETLDKLHDAKKRMDTDEVFASNYSEKDYRTGITVTYCHAAKSLVAIYWPALLSGVTSVACILAGQNIIQKRYVCSVAACNQINRLFKEYRNRVVDDIGEDADRKYRYGIENVNVVSPELDKKGNPKTDKNGEVKTKVETVSTIDGKRINRYDYCRVFDEVSSKEWDSSAAYNKQWLLQQNKIATEMLRGRGYLFLNEVYRMLGFPITDEGQDIGWIYIKGESDPNKHVDFGMYEIMETGESHFDAMTEANNAILLSFNCDGYIRDRLFESQVVYD